MGKIIGIDIGGSTTKIVGFNLGSIFSPMLVKANDPIASVYGALGKFLDMNELALNDIERIMVTGVGSSFISSRLFGIPTGKVDEFLSIGKGGLFMSGLSNAVIVSMGTGTAFIKADSNGVRHIGGSGVGGGTLLGLSNRMLNVRGFNDLICTASAGSLSHVDLTIGDLTHDKLEGLPSDSTASNFGNLSDLATKEDVALGIINLVFQTVGMIAIFAARIDNTKDIVLTGNLTNVPHGHRIFDQLGDLFKLTFHTPINAEYATAAGAAISYMEGNSFKELPTI
jgi:type II pantothenate kinase